MTVKKNSIKKLEPGKNLELSLWLKDAKLKELKDHPDRVATLCSAIRNFGYSDEARDIEQFCLLHKFRAFKLYEWRQHFPELDAACNEMKEAIHIRRRMLWGENKLNKDSFLRYAHNYSSDEDTINKYHAALRKDENEKSGLVYIEVPAAKVTGKIKPREIKDGQEVQDL